MLCCAKTFFRLLGWLQSSRLRSRRHYVQPVVPSLRRALPTEPRSEDRHVQAVRRAANQRSLQAMSGKLGC